MTIEQQDEWRHCEHCDEERHRQRQRGCIEHHCPKDCQGIGQAAPVAGGIIAWARPSNCEQSQLPPRDYGQALATSKARPASGMVKELAAALTSGRAVLREKL